MASSSGHSARQAWGLFLALKVQPAPSSSSTHRAWQNGPTQQPPLLLGWGRSQPGSSTWQLVWKILTTSTGFWKTTDVSTQVVFSTLFACSHPLPRQPQISHTILTPADGCAPLSLRIEPPIDYQDFERGHARDLMSLVLSQLVLNEPFVSRQQVLLIWMATPETDVMETGDGRHSSRPQLQ